ncbi:MAG: glycosyltransferase [Synergistaceae bacterium]|nr:glycosyltransferase [Synergistaceae bacterium]
MRISIIINNMHGGGAERVALTLLNNFIDNGHTVQVVLFKREGILLPQIPQNAQLSVLDCSPSIFSALNPFSGLRKWLKTLKRWGDSDVLLCFSSKVNRAMLLANILEKTNVPIIVTEHNVFSKDIGERYFLRRMYLLLMSKWLYKKADAFVAASDYVRNDVVRLGVVPEETSHYIYNPIVLKENPNEDLHPWFEDCSLEVVVSVGSFFRVKDYPTLIRAFALLHKRRPQTRLIILGEGGNSSRAEKLIKELDLKDYVNMPGFCNPYQYMKFARILVCSSKHEAFSLAVGEALLSGLNVVSTNCGGPSELLGHGKYGRLVPVGDFNVLASSMEEAIKNPISPDILKLRASGFLPGKISSQYIELMMKLINASKKKVQVISLQQGQKVLWIELGGFGDVAQAITDIKNLKDKFPETKFSILTKPQWKEFADSQPCISSVITGNKKPLSVMLSTAKKVRKEKFDWISDISSGGSHSFMLQYLCCKPKKIPIRTERLREEPSLFITQTQKEDSEKILSKLNKKRVFICPGAGGTALKKWPAEYWNDFLQWLVSLGWSVVIVGHGEKEKQEADKIIANLPEDKYLNLVNQLDTIDFLAVALSCEVAVGNDTGPLHIAALGGVPSVGIFSCPTSWRLGFRMPWFIEVTATNELRKFRWEDEKTEYILHKLKPEKVKEAFNKAIKFGLITKNNVNKQ